MLELFRAGGPVMVPLLACSVLTVAVIVERGWYWWRVASGREPIVARILAAETGAGGGDGDDGHSSAEAVARMRLAAEREAARLGRYLGILGTMVSLAPLLGIFGTVLGIMESFQLLDASAAAAPMAAKQGLAKALLTTAFGLLVAMLSLIALKIFQSRVIAQREAIERACSERELALAIARGERP